MIRYYTSLQKLILLEGRFGGKLITNIDTSINPYVITHLGESILIIPFNLEFAFTKFSLKVIQPPLSDLFNKRKWNDS